MSTGVTLCRPCRRPVLVVSLKPFALEHLLAVLSAGGGAHCRSADAGILFLLSDQTAPSRSAGLRTPQGPRLSTCV